MFHRYHNIENCETLKDIENVEQRAPNLVLIQFEVVFFDACFQIIVVEEKDSTDASLFSVV